MSSKAELAVEEASELVKCVVAVDAGATVTARIWLTARQLGWSDSRTRDFWYSQARVVQSHEMDALRKAAADEYRRLCERVVRLEASLQHTDEDFRGPQIDALEQARRGLDRTGD